MKKLLLLIACAAMFAGCKQEPRIEQTIFLHLEDSEGKLITLKPQNTTVYIFKDNGKVIDNLKTASSLRTDSKLTYVDGSMSEKYVFIDGGTVVYTFENVPNGKYVLWVHYWPYSNGKHSSKKLAVSESSHLMIEKKKFRDLSGYYEEW